MIICNYYSSFLPVRLKNLGLLRCLSQTLIESDQIFEKPVNSRSSSKKKGNKSTNSFCCPPLKASQLSELSSAVAVNLKLDNVSWAKICISGNQLTDWNYFSLPQGVTKMDLLTLYQLAVDIHLKLPSADLYVMDQLKSRFNSKNPAASSAFITKLQLISMLTTMINFRERDKIESTTSECSSNFQSKVVLLKPHLVTKLFKLLVEDECISVEPVVMKVLKNELSKIHTPIKVSLDAHLNYTLIRSDVERENLGMALLMGVAFMDLVVYKNPDSYTSFLKSC